MSLFLITKGGNVSVANYHSSRIKSVPNKMPTEIIILMKYPSKRRWIVSLTSKVWTQASFKNCSNFTTKISTLQTVLLDLQPGSFELKGVPPFRCKLQIKIAVWEIRAVFILNRWLLFKRELLGTLLWPCWCCDMLSGACHFSIWCRQLLEAEPIEKVAHTLQLLLYVS